MSFIRKILLRSLGEKKYLSLLANSFQRLYKTGRLGTDYQDIYFLKNIIRPGDQCIDIGAHLGYFTLELSRLVKDNGHVYAVEPMSVFYQTLGSLLSRKKIKNVTLNQYAMGGEGPFVEMGIPRIGKTKKFAYARVIQSSVHLEYSDSQRVKNIKGDEFFKELPKIDFIKCDVEGLEVAVFSTFLELIGKHHPIILCELGDPKDRGRFYSLLETLSYRLFYLENRQLYPMDVESEVRPVSHNHYFIPSSRLNQLETVMHHIPASD